MKKLLLCLFGLAFFVSLKAQHTFISYDYDVYSNGKLIESSVSRKQIFNVSFSDKLFIHNVFSDYQPTQIDVSQIYVVTEQSFENNVYYFTVLSGLSGNSYYYGLKIKNDDAYFYQFDDESRKSYKRFNGTLTPLKTYIQGLE